MRLIRIKLDSNIMMEIYGVLNTVFYLNCFYYVKIALLSNMHPESGKPLFILGRWSSFVPVNIPIVIGMSIA